MGNRNRSSDDARRVAGLHVLTDTSIQHRFTHGQLAESAARGGACVVQLRAKTASTRKLLDWGREALKACREHDCLFLINDRVDVALALRADGVHLGQDDMPVAAARELLGPDAIIGSSVHSSDELRVAQEEGATYAAFGPIYRTRTKPDVGPVRGLRELFALCEASPLPVVAIGGIGPAQVQEVLAVGAAGIAVSSAVCLDPEPRLATRGLVQAMRRAGRSLGDAGRP